MKLKELEVHFGRDEGSGDEDEEGGGCGQEIIGQDLLRAMKNNFCLLSVKGDIISNVFGTYLDLFESVEDKKTLACYSMSTETSV